MTSEDDLKQDLINIFSGVSLERNIESTLNSMCLLLDSLEYLSIIDLSTASREDLLEILDKARQIVEFATKIAKH